MKTVLDASAALEVVFERRFCESIFDILTESETIIAPDLYHAEIGNALWRNVMVGSINFEVAREYYDKAVGLVEKFVDLACLTPTAMRRASTLNHSIYDMYYLVLSDYHDAHLISLDKRLVALAKEQGLSPVEFGYYYTDKGKCIVEIAN